MTAEWRCARVYYHDEGRTDSLLLDAVQPLLARIAPDVQAAFFVRHWRQGPHIRVCVRCPSSIFRDIVMPAVSDLVGGYLAARPSRVRLDATTLLAAHTELARREFERGPIRPIYPDNSVRYGTYDRRVHVLGSVQAAELLERFYESTNDFTFELLDATRGGASTLAIGLDLMLATAHAMWPGITRGFLSYRAHAEGFLIQAADPAGLRQAWREAFLSQSTALTQRVRVIVGMLDGQSAPAEHVRRWVDALSPFSERAEALAREGNLRLAAGGEEGLANGWRTENLVHSEFQREIYRNAAYIRYLRGDARFQRYRFLLNLLYLHLHRLGIGAVDRYYLCHLVADAVEEATGVSALSLVSHKSQ